MVKKVVISSSNAKAIAFLEEMNRKKDEMRKKLAKKMEERKVNKKVV